MSTDIAVSTRPLRADAQRNRDAIVEVAQQAFAENGTQCSLDDIACRAGVGPGTLYRHFPTRDSLIVAALDGHSSELHATADRLEASDDPLAALREWLIVMASHFGTYGGLTESVAKARADADSPLAASCGFFEGRTSQLLDRAQVAGAVRRDASGEDLFVIANTLAATAKARGYGPDDLPRLVDLFIGGLR